MPSHYPISRWEIQAIDKQTRNYDILGSNYHPSPLNPIYVYRILGNKVSVHILHYYYTMYLAVFYYNLRSLVWQWNTDHFRVICLLLLKIDFLN